MGAILSNVDFWDIPLFVSRESEILI